MKQTSIIGIIILLVLVGCGDDKQSTDDFIMVDVTASYPKKELILQNFMDVEYIPLETTNEFICQGLVMDIGKKYVIVINRNFDGDIFIFNRSGKGVKKINRKGQGNGEYTYITGITLDENRNEMFVNEHLAKRIIVYDLDGNYKRTIPYKQGALVTNLYDYDENHFLSQNVYSPENESSSSTFFLLSTQDGSWTDIELPYGKRISPVIVKRAADGIYASVPGNSFISSYQGDWILSEPSADTIYAHRPNGDLRPFMVRTPSVQTMTPEVFLFPGVLTDRYYFMQTVKKECDFEKNDKMPTVDLIYDRQEKKIYHSIVHNADFDNREEDLSVCALNEEVAFAVSLDALSLIEGKGKLKGQLKEIAAHLGEEDNPVVMLAKIKNF